MGGALARALQRAGHGVTVWNRSSEKMEPHLANGATGASSVVSAVMAGPVIMVCVDNYAATQSFLGTHEVQSSSNVYQQEKIMNIATRVLALPVFVLSISVHAVSYGANAKATMINKEGKEIGFAEVTQAPTGVLIHLRVSGLQPGKHGLHLHSLGVCEPGEGFKTAKGHVGKVEGAHGLMNPKGPEPGDLPNLFVGADGVGETELFTTLVSVSGGDHPLLDADGSTFIIHEAADDHLTQPIGGAGGRVACGIIESAN